MQSAKKSPDPFFCSVLLGLLPVIGCAPPEPEAALPSSAIRLYILADGNSAGSAAANLASTSNSDAFELDSTAYRWLPIANGSLAATEIASIQSAVSRTRDGKLEARVLIPEQIVSGSEIGFYRADGTFESSPGVHLPTIDFEMLPSSKMKLFHLTLENRGHRLAIVIDDEIWALPVIIAPVHNVFMVMFPNRESRDHALARLRRGLQ